MQESELAYKAADYIAQHGHCKGKLFDSKGRVCWSGAIKMAAGGLDYGLVDYLALNRACITILACRGDDYNPVVYNDLPGTTGEDIILLLKQAAHLLEEEDR